MSEETKVEGENKIVDEVAVDYTKHWKKYYENVAGERMKEISKLAKENKFTIDVLNEESGEWEPKTYVYREIPTKKWMELETLRSRYNDTEKVAAAKLITTKGNDEYKFAEQLNEMLSELYRKSAEYFLKMPQTEYDNSKWTQIKSIIDACNHRTIFTLPN